VVKLCFEGFIIRGLAQLETLGGKWWEPVLKTHVAVLCGTALEFVSE
jgi:hypothetical protein